MGKLARIVAAATGLALLAAACTGSTDTVEGGVVIREAPTVARPAIPGEPSAQFLRETRVFADSAPIPNVQRQYGIAPVVLDPGTYTFDALGTPVTLQLTDFWRLEDEYPGYLSLTRPDAELETLLPAFSLHRVIGYADPALVSFGGSPGTAGWRMWDLQEWIDAVPQVVVLDQGELTVDGRSVRWWDIDVDPDRGPTFDGCQPGTCVTFMWSGTHLMSVARDLERIRWYQIEDPLGPMIGFVSVADSEWAEFSAAVHGLVVGATFGEPAPHPIPDDTVYALDAGAGSNTWWAFSGVEGIGINSPGYFNVAQRPGEVGARPGTGRYFEARTSVVVPVSDGTGAPIASADDLAALIQASADTVVSVRSDELFGTEATVIDIEHRGDPIVLLSERWEDYDMREARWPNLAVNEAWVIDSPLGPAMIVVAGATRFDFENAREHFEWFVESLEFCTPAAETCGGER